ncbi:hypothetical protein Tco_0924915 [Tanacetum coccineum]|uniref:Uncharacterized protein n=1 Tax=Tanacetum coccineum TaxID=301880 RepID=A0ABQ5D5B7_9ASTR
MEEYIILQEEKALSQGETFNWQTAMYGKMELCEDEDDCFKNFKTKFPAIVLDNTLTSDAAISCGLTVSPLNNNEIDFRILFDESDDEDYTPKVSYSNDLDFFKDFENAFSVIVYNDALTSKSNFLTEHIISPQHIDEFNNETSLSKCDEKEQNILYFNDLFPFNVIYPDDLKTDTDNDNDKIDIEQTSGDMSITPIPNVINVNAQGSDMLSETMLAGRQPEIYLSVIESVFPDCLYGVSKPHGYGVLTFWTLSSLYFQQSLYDVFIKRIQDLLNEMTTLVEYFVLNLSGHAEALVNTLFCSRTHLGELSRAKHQGVFRSNSISLII